MGRAVLITGGTGWLGAAVTARFLEEGHNVVATARGGGWPENVSRNLDHFGERLHLIEGDVTQPDSVAVLVEATVARLGTIEVLVHLVGGWEGGRPLQDVPLETWERMLDVNLRSAFLCSRAVLPIMRQQGWGRIVFVSSQAARTDRSGQGAYAIAKAGVAVMAETIAEENNDLNVTANAVAPSSLDTPANRAASDDADDAALVPARDVAKMIAFLASDEAGQLRGAWLPAFGRS